MGNYKLRVNSDAESREAQELFLQLGYEKGTCSEGNYPADIVAVPSSFFSNNPFSSRSVKLDHEEHEGFEKITLAELHDMVVLKRNDKNDRNVVDPEYPYVNLYLDSNNNLFVFHIPTQTWKESNLNCDRKALARLKPIEKTMKEYINKTTGEYRKTTEKVTGEQWVEVDSHYNFAFKKTNGDVRFSESCFNSYFGEVLLWQGATLPEELPFIDDEPQLNTPMADSQLMDGCSMDRTQSINDQYAELELVRQQLKTMGVDLPKPSAWDTQVGGNHYKQFKIQPMQFALENKLDAAQQNVIKYVMRHSFKNGKQDLEKAKHYIDLMIEFYYGDNNNG